MDVIVVEARDRIGGRTQSIDLGDGSVDLGGAWVHDQGHNPLTPYLDSVGIPGGSDGMWGQGMRAFEGGFWLSSEVIGATAADMQTLADPIGPRVLLAGEHTYPAYYGTVQAAWLSGKRPAETILSKLGR